MAQSLRWTKIFLIKSKVRKKKRSTSIDSLKVYFKILRLIKTQRSSLVRSDLNIFPIEPTSFITLSISSSSFSIAGVIFYPDRRAADRKWDESLFCEIFGPSRFLKKADRLRKSQQTVTPPKERRINGNRIPSRDQLLTDSFLMNGIVNSQSSILLVRMKLASCVLNSKMSVPNGHDTGLGSSYCGLRVNLLTIKVEAFKNRLPFSV